MWTATSERLPTARDADDRSCVLTWHIYQGCMILGWHQIRQNDPYISHWQPIPEAPENADEERETREKRIKEKRWFASP